ncbi:MAG TPA: TrmH family RNA methyltransferase, partial [Gemmatimonadales bacterium]|nr:TrmH family RNA methyltransferase [Gemmatimonadales bacterium]
MKNFGLGRLRLVSPAEWDPWRVLGIAHDTEDVIEATRTFDTLPEALADCSFVVGMTARGRRVKRNLERPRSVAPDLLERAARHTEDGPVGPVGILFGREDHGLPNWALDLCHRTVTIPTNPEHASLNLAQAVLVMAYELWMSAHGEEQPFKEPRRVAAPANVELLRKMFEDVERALWTVDFFKTRQTESTLRTLRELAHRADLDAREAGFLRAIAIEVVKSFERERPSPP